MADTAPSAPLRPCAEQVVYITGPRIAFAVLIEGKSGFGQIVVELQPGQRETVTMPNGTRVTVVREYLH